MPIARRVLSLRCLVVGARHQQYPCARSMCKYLYLALIHATMSTVITFISIVQRPHRLRPVPQALVSQLFELLAARDLRAIRGKAREGVRHPMTCTDSVLTSPDACRALGLFPSALTIACKLLSYLPNTGIFLLSLSDLIQLTEPSKVYSVSVSRRVLSIV